MSRRETATQQAVDADEVGALLFTFGKHINQCFQRVHTQDPKYENYVRGKIEAQAFKAVHMVNAQKCC